MDERGWKVWKDKLPRGYRWGVQYAVRRNRKERAIGGMLMGVKIGLSEREKEFEMGGKGLISEWVKVGEERWRIVGLYINGDMEGKLQVLKEWAEIKEEGIRTLIRGTLMQGQVIREGEWVWRKVRGKREYVAAKGIRRTERLIGMAGC